MIRWGVAFLCTDRDRLAAGLAGDDSTGGASCDTLAAVDAFLRINRSDIICHSNRALLTGFLALLTADTAIFTDLACYSSFILGTASNIDRVGGRDHRDQMVRAHLGAHSAADAN